MIRNINVKSEEIYSEFIDSVQSLMLKLEQKKKELDKLKESDRTRAHHTLKLIQEWFNKRGGTSL